MELTFKTSPLRLTLDEIHTHPDIQVRTVTDEATVERYAQRYRDGQFLPAIRVCILDKDAKIYLIDGHHRLAAARAAGLDTIEAFLAEQRVTLADMISEGISFNARQGLALSTADRKRAAEMLCKYYPSITVRDAAARVGLSKSLVAEVLKAYKAQTVAVCKECKAQVLRIFAENSTSGWVSVYQHEKEFWFCSEEHRSVYFAKQTEKQDAARLKALDKEPVQHQTECDAEEEESNVLETYSFDSDIFCLEAAYTPEIPSLPTVVITQTPHDVCPFCGSEPKAYATGENWFIKCRNTACTCFPGTDIYASEDEAWRHWDQRYTHYGFNRSQWDFFQKLRNGYAADGMNLALITDNEQGISLRIDVCQCDGSILNYTLD